MAAYPLDVDNLPAPRPWRGVVRFFAWLTIFGSIAPIAAYVLGTRQLALPHGTGLAHALQYEPFHLLRKLIVRLSALHFNANLLLFAPVGIAALCALFSLGGPHWRRIMLALLGLLAAVFNLFTCLSLVWAFSWDENAAGVIDPLNYAALSASLISVVVAFGFLFLALASAWRWPLLYARRALIVARWWVLLIASGAALLIASFFTAWGSWRSPGYPVSEETTIPIGLRLAGQSDGQATMLLLLLAPPAIAALSALLALAAPRWLRVALSLLSLLAGVSSLVVCFLPLGRLFLRASGYGALDTGGVVGLGAGILIVIAAFGLLSTPYPARRRAPLTRVLAESLPMRAA